MRFTKAVAAGVIISSLYSLNGWAQTPTAIPSSPTPVTTNTPVPTTTPTPITAKLKTIKKRRFLITHTSAIYEQPDRSSKIIGHVRRRAHVSVTGVIGDWLQIELADGKTAYIPSIAAE